jgi:hypothetical protein
VIGDALPSRNLRISVCASAWATAPSSSMWQGRTYAMDGPAEPARALVHLSAGAALVATVEQDVRLADA